MSTERNVSQRVAEFPRNTPRVVLGMVVTIGLALGLRVVAGLFIEDPIHPVTYLALVGGGFGATAMYGAVYWMNEDQRFAPIEFWANVLGDGSVAQYRHQGIYLHVTYGAIVGAFFPRVMFLLTGDGEWFAQLPLSLGTGVGYGLAVFVLGVIYAQIGFFKLELTARRVALFLANHVVYGLVLGLVSGLWLTTVESMV